MYSPLPFVLVLLLCVSEPAAAARRDVPLSGRECKMLLRGDHFLNREAGVRAFLVILKRACQKDPDERFASAHEMAQALDALIESSGKQR